MKIASFFSSSSSRSAVRLDVEHGCTQNGIRFHKDIQRATVEICKFSDVNERKGKNYETVISFNLCVVNYNFIVSSVFFAVELVSKHGRKKNRFSHMDNIIKNDVCVLTGLGSSHKNDILVPNRCRPRFDNP